MSFFVFPCLSQTGARTAALGPNTTTLFDLKIRRLIHVRCIRFCSKQLKSNVWKQERFEWSYIWITTDAFVLAFSGVSRLIVKPTHTLFDYGMWVGCQCKFS